MLTQDGFKEAKTVADLLHNPKTQEQIRNGVVWIDEASQLSVPDMNKVLGLASKQNARVILTGDPFRLIGIYNGIPLQQVTQIRRQQDIRYCQAVQELARGNTEAGIHQMDVMGAIQEITASIKSLRQNYNFKSLIFWYAPDELHIVSLDNFLKVLRE